MTDWFLIEGLNPEPWQASEGSVGRKNGKLFVMFHKPSQLRQYQEAIKEEFFNQYPGFSSIYRDSICIQFFFWRRLEQYEGSDRKSRAHFADVTNLQKSTEDALQGILYPNDRNVRRVTSEIVIQTQDAHSAILIGIGNHSGKELVDAVITRSTILAEREAKLPIDFQNTSRPSNVSDIF